MFTPYTEYLTQKIEDAFPEFILDKNISGLSTRTIDFYKDELRPFINYCKENNIECLPEITSALIRNHLSVLSMRRNPGGVHARFRAIRAFLNWSWNEYDLEIRNPISKVKPPKVNKNPIPGVQINDVMKMVETCYKTIKTRQNKRDNAILLVLLDTALRASEFLALNWSDVDLLTGTVYVKNGKGGKARYAHIGKHATKALRIWKRHTPHTEYIWSSERGNRLTRSGLTNVLRRRAKYANIPPPSIHDFRRASLLAMLRNGADLASVSRYAGHSDIHITLRYLAQNQDDIKMVHSKTSPVDNFF